MKLLIADDHALTREGLCLLLQKLEPHTAVFEAGGYEELAALLAEHPDADLAIVDLDMPGRTEGTTLAALRQRHPTVPMVVLSGCEDREEMRRALGSGAMGYLPKSASPQVLLNALRLVLAGGVYVPPALIEADAAEPVADREADVALSPRQHEVLGQLMLGKSNKEIARALGMSEATVKVHLGAVFRALRVTSRTQAVRAAQRKRLIEPN
jgi:two-component system nitrate/nitrite response regulator NarL